VNVTQGRAFSMLSHGRDQTTQPYRLAFIERAGEPATTEAPSRRGSYDQ
jgi:hypothetical protein